MLQASNQARQESDKAEGSILNAQRISKLNTLLLAKGIITLTEACAVTDYDDPNLLIQGFGMQTAFA